MKLLHAASRLPSGAKSTLKMRPGIGGNFRTRFELSPITRLVTRVSRKICGTPSEPPTSTSSFFGCTVMAWMPPLSAPGVMEVMLSTKREVATSVSFTAMSRPTETK